MLSAVAKRLLPAPRGLLGVVVSSILNVLILGSGNAHFSAQERCGQTKLSLFCELLPKSEAEIVSKEENSIAGPAEQDFSRGHTATGWNEV